MKKALIIILLVYICLNVFSGCKETYRENMPDKSQYSETNISETQEVVFVTENNNEPDISSDKQVDGYGGASITTREYRDRYYSVPYQFVVLVGTDAFWEWDSQYDSEKYAANDKMVIKEFVQYFNISREDFDRANLEFAKVVISGFGGTPVMNPKDFANQEIHEIYNADIIYTFDDTIINEYYLSPDYPYLFSYEYDEAVENGTYETRTTDWIDIEQMEAEIIAKYGETEQVKNNEEIQSTETAGSSAETTAPEQTEAVTTE